MEGIVLLENDGCLPVNPKINHGKLALYGAGAKNDDQRVEPDQERSMSDMQYQFWKEWNNAGFTDYNDATGLMIMIRVFEEGEQRIRRRISARN